MQEVKNKIEAVLFTTGRFMDLEELAKLSGIASIGFLKDALMELKQDYENKDSALQIFEQNQKFKLNIRKEFNYLTTNLLSDSELDPPTTKTLALIAYKQPVLQADIVKMRGNTAYDHIKVLKEQNFVISEKQGRTRILKLSPRFFDYFDVVHDQLQMKFESVKAKEEETENLRKELEILEEREAKENQENKEELSKMPDPDNQSPKGPIEDYSETNETTPETQTKESDAETPEEPEEQPDTSEEDKPATPEEPIEDPQEEQFEEEPAEDNSDQTQPL